MTSSRDKIFLAKKLNGEFASIFGFQLNPFVDMMGFNICDFDDKLAQMDPEYDNVNCTYKGEPDVAMADYVIAKFGERAIQIIRELL